MRVVFILFLIQNCYYTEFSRLSGKCEKEKKKQRICEIKNLIACQYSPDAASYKKLGVDICTNPDGYAFLLIGICQGNISYECSGSSSRSNRDSN